MKPRAGRSTYTRTLRKMVGEASRQAGSWVVAGVPGILEAAVARMAKELDARNARSREAGRRGGRKPIVADPERLDDAEERLAAITTAKGARRTLLAEKLAEETGTLADSVLRAARRHAARRRAARAARAR